MKSENAQSFSMMKLFAVIGGLALLTLVLIPAVSRAKLKADQVMVGAHGRDIYVALVGAACENLGPMSIWPRVTIAEEYMHQDAQTYYVMEKMFQNSTEYFYDLYDGANAGTPEHSPYIAGFDYSKLAGAGVPRVVGTGVLKPENNMWCIAGNLREDMDDRIPVLVTRNVDCSSFHIKTHGNPDAPLQWSQQYKTPFGRKCFVMVRKGGAVSHGAAKNATVGTVYPVGSVPVAGGTNLASLVYLTPDGIVCPQ
ncbi:MAG: hypothetical protein FWG50_13945 [Kiritimatiellaeota bacterium]|nr:hypothetical protein [Kiritimatiellota bacterium]